ncbi:hypothetical protein CH267_22165 [Rhodococcus sp. 06-621-2]|nr:hypothetical protein CH267_22165 [Rhodococcus sp. 06-621-2]
MREAFDSGFTLYFSDHSSISVAGTFGFRSADGESSTLAASPTGLASHASGLVALIGMKVGAVNSNGDDAIALVFTSGIALVVPRSGSSSISTLGLAP